MKPWKIDDIETDLLHIQCGLRSLEKCFSGYGSAVDMVSNAVIKEELKEYQDMLAYHINSCLKDTAHALEQLDARHQEEGEHA